ncbi:MAG: asparagine synthase (glutamine-hydrolyzing) [Gammaproteobacteria bacterium]|nr:MAG: asparagine synthase (glutamine-hydrolyzing) [Gammaproteobacteria bacterium]
MCGINGIFSYHASAPAVDNEELIKTRDFMISRGPDGAGSLVSADNRIGLAHRRLSIIDLSENAAQPMSTPDGTLTIVFNGEIYNYQSLQTILTKKGIHLKTKSDTEVLLHLYNLFGSAMLEFLRGMFSFAIWDKNKKNLFLARDRYGIKPLYYSNIAGQFRFASQVSALQFARPNLYSTNPAGVTGFFLWGSIPEPLTLYQEIYSLPAGTSMLVSGVGLEQPIKYWSIIQTIQKSHLAAKDIPVGEEISYLRASLLDSVKAHQVSDVPVGAFLSAGLDSSTIVGLASETQTEELNTFTLAFDEFKNNPLDELPAASEIARIFGVRHQSIRINIKEMENELDHFFSAMDQPTIDGLNTWFVSKFAADQGLKVALSGVGGDELLGGYQTFQKIPEKVNKFPAFLSNPRISSLYKFAFKTLSSRLVRIDPRLSGLLDFGGTFQGVYQMQRGLFMPWELTQFLNKDFVHQGISILNEKMFLPSDEPDFTNLSSFGKVAAMESSLYMRNQLLRDTDWIGMAHSLEIRTPLVDHLLTEKIIGMASAGRLGKGKSMMPLVLSKKLPSSIINRPKTGFTIPIWRWLNISEQLGHWKQVPDLCHPNVSATRRWAYTLMAKHPNSNEFLRTAR